MQWNLIERSLRRAGASLGAACCGTLVQASDTVTPAAANVPKTASLWPWVAVAAIVGLLAVIALVARRRLPFGGKG
jgi:hypothetical protein